MGRNLQHHTVEPPFVYITHDQSEALVMSDRVAVMNRGRFEQVGTPQELYHHPASGFVAGFVGDANRWAGRVAAANDGQARVETEAGEPTLCTARREERRGGEGGVSTGESRWS